MKWRGPKKVPIRSAYRYYTQYRPKNPEYVLTEGEFGKVVRDVFILIGESLLAGNIIELPFKLGSLSVELRQSQPYFDNDGNFINNAPVHWGNTKKLWEVDPEARQNKTLVRCENSKIFYIKYYKRKARYHNKKYISFKTSRTLKKKMAQLAYTDTLQALTVKRWQ